MIPTDFDFRAHSPKGVLATSVAQIFYGRGTTPHARERILPSPGAVLLVVLGPPLRMTPPRPGAEPLELEGAWLTGPHDRPILNEPSGETHVVGALFHPGGLAAFMDGSVEAVSHRLVRLDEVRTSLPPGAELVAQLEGLVEAHQAITALRARLEESVSGSRPDRAWRRAITELMGGSRLVGELQSEMGVSRRYFTERIRRQVGLTPKALQRIARLRRLLDELDARRPIRWSAEAVGAGYFDQPHAIRDFRALTGMTPTEYVERRRAAWGHEVEPGEAINFVPELVR